jgi:transcriptional regulator with XRE-family HTH domain
MTLQQLCAARGLTLEQLAARAGVAVSTVVRINAGTLRLHPLTRDRLAAALDVDPATLRDELSATRRGQVRRDIFSGTEGRAR